MKKSKIMYLMSAALLLAGCAADEQQVPVSQRVPITLNTLMVEGSLTRADNVNIQSTQFDKNQTFYAYFPENVTVGNVTSESHAVYTTDGVGNTTTDPQPYFNAGQESATVHAYYPYFAGDGGKQVTNTTESFSVEKNQHQVSGYNESDLMYATTTVEKTSPTGTLLFTHKMAKIIVNASAADNLTITDVRIVGGKRTINIATPQSCTLGETLSDANSTTDYITMFTGGNNATAVCAALLPPQELSSSNALIEIVTKDGNNTVASAKYSIAKTIESANSYTLNLTVTQASLNTTTAISNWSNNSGSTNTGELVIGDVDVQMWTGSEIRPTPVVTCNGNTLTNGVDYELVYTNNINVGTASVFAIGIGSTYEGKIAAKAFVVRGYGEFNYDIISVPKTYLYDDPFTNELNYTGDGIVTYSSSDEDVATINSSGEVTLVGCGTTTISASVTDTKYYKYLTSNATYTLYVGVPLSSATSSDLGKTICSYGHIHNSASDIENTCGGSAVAIIGYLGAAGNAEASSQNYKGLAMSLHYTENNKKYKWGDYNCDAAVANVKDYDAMYNNISGVSNTSILNSWSYHLGATAAANYGVSLSNISSPHSVWFLPCMGQWLRVLHENGVGNASDINAHTGNYLDTDLTARTNINAALENAGGTQITGYSYILTASEYDHQYGLAIELNDSGVRISWANKDSESYYVRAFFAF